MWVGRHDARGAWRRAGTAGLGATAVEPAGRVGRSASSRVGTRPLACGFARACDRLVVVGGWWVGRTSPATSSNESYSQYEVCCEPCTLAGWTRVLSPSGTGERDFSGILERDVEKR